MSPVTDPAAVEELMRRDSDTVFATLMDITPDPRDPSASDPRWPLRLAEHPEDVTFSGNTYFGVPMHFVAPQQGAQDVPVVRIRAPGVGLSYTDLFRSSARPMQIAPFKVSFDDVSGPTSTLKLRSYGGGDLVVTGVVGSFGLEFTVTRRNLLDAPHPIRRYDPHWWPSLF